MRILKTKTKKEISLWFDINSNAIFDIKWHLSYGDLFSCYISLFWVRLEYTDWMKIPF